MTLSAAWASAGFDRSESERWRSAGWVDAGAAASWRRADPTATPAALRRLHDLDYEPRQVDHVRSLVSVGAAAWTRVLLPLDDPDEAGAIDLRDPDSWVVRLASSSETTATT